MKNYKFLLLAVVGVAVASFNLVALADNDRAGVVTVIRIVGNSEYSIDGGHQWLPVVVGKEFSPGTLVRSEDKSLVDLLIGQSLPERNIRILQYPWRQYQSPNVLPQVERNMVRLQPNTILGIDKLLVPDSNPATVSDCELNLKKGRIFASVRKVSPSSEYLVKIPNGVAAVRGTQFSLSTDGSDSSCQVAQGTVWLSFTLVDSNGNPVLGPDGNPLAPVQISLTPGQQFDLTGSLLSQINGLLSQGGVSSSNLQNLITQITNLANSAIGSITAGQLATLNVMLSGLETLRITVTTPSAPGGSITPPDNGVPPVVTTL